MYQFLLNLSAWFRSRAIKKLHIRRFKPLSDSDRSEVAIHLLAMQREAEQVLKIMSAYSPGAVKRPAGFYLRFGGGPSAEQPRVIIYDMVDGTHCYEIDPPGICCCDPC